MLDYNDLNDEEKRVLRNALNVERISAFYLEDNRIVIMEAKELFEYIYLYDIKKAKDAIKLIETIIENKIYDNDVNKTILQKIIEKNNKVIKLSNLHYAYKENN